MVSFLFDTDSTRVFCRFGCSCQAELLPTKSSNWKKIIDNIIVNVAISDVFLLLFIHWRPELDSSIWVRKAIECRIDDCRDPFNGIYSQQCCEERWEVSISNFEDSWGSFGVFRPYTQNIYRRAVLFAHASIGSTSFRCVGMKNPCVLFLALFWRQITPERLLHTTRRSLKLRTTKFRHAVSYASFGNSGTTVHTPTGIPVTREWQHQRLDAIHFCVLSRFRFGKRWLEIFLIWFYKHINQSVTSTIGDTCHINH